MSEGRYMSNFMLPPESFVGDGSNERNPTRYLCSHFQRSRVCILTIASEVTI